MAQQPWRTGKIIRIEDETSTTKKFWIQIPEIDHFDFTPGQFVTLDLPIHEQPNKRWRSYSIASPPNGSNVFELIIVLMEGGLGTTYLFNEAKIGTEFPVRGPQGHFTLTDPITTDIFMVCTGTGIAPFRSMIQHIHHNNIPHKEIYLIYGTRKCSDALYLEEMFDLKTKLPSFHYFPTFSREQEVTEGHYIGYVHGIYEKLLQGKVETPQFYLCGWKDMINDARQRIQVMGIDKKSIHFELYG
ncbi:MAG: ferredoxin--NADP reductase [Chitinophagaceae bacterium]